jgi:hypothetical protein
VTTVWALIPVNVAVRALSLDLHWLGVDDRGALGNPLLWCHRLVADDVLTNRGLNLPRVPPVSWISVLQPKNAGDVRRRHVFAVRHDHGLLCSGRHEDLHRVVAVAYGLLVEAALDARVGFLFAQWRCGIGV